MKISASLGNDGRHSTRESGVALSGEQRLRRKVDRDERRRAAGRYGDGRACQSEAVGDLQGQVVRLRGDRGLHAAQRIAATARRIPSTGEVVCEVAALRGPDEDADGSTAATVPVSAVFEGKPGALHQHAVLRIEGTRLRVGESPC